MDTKTQQIVSKNIYLGKKYSEIKYLTNKKWVIIDEIVIDP